MRDVVLLIGADHQKFMLMARRAMQPVAAVEHEDLERRDPELLDQHRNFCYLIPIDRREVVGVIDIEAPAASF
jgi:hypothetical protein